MINSYGAIIAISHYCCNAEQDEQNAAAHLDEGASHEGMDHSQPDHNQPDHNSMMHEHLASSGKEDLALDVLPICCLLQRDDLPIQTAISLKKLASSQFEIQANSVELVFGEVERSISHSSSRPLSKTTPPYLLFETFLI